MKAIIRIDVPEYQIGQEVSCYFKDTMNVQGICEAERTGHWIPVSERLPKEENNHYWICTDCGYQCECRWTNVNHFWTNLTTDWHWHIMDIPQYSKVIAWMPLPKSYEPQERGDKE